MTAFGPLIADQPGATDLALMQSLLGRRLSAAVSSLAVIGAHRFDEKGLIDWIFPGLKSIHLFEPLASVRAELHAMAAQDPRVHVLHHAVGSTDGEREFLVSSNDGESSSLLKFGTHADLFPEVRLDRSERVSCRRIDTLVAAGEMTVPDFIIIDVQGAEYEVLSSLGSVRDHVRLIYTEVSTEQVYEGAKVLSEIQALLAPDFVLVGYAPLMDRTPMHGNAIFVRASDAAAVLGYTAKGWLRRMRDRVFG